MLALVLVKGDVEKGFVQCMGGSVAMRSFAAALSTLTTCVCRSPSFPTALIRQVRHSSRSLLAQRSSQALCNSVKASLSSHICTSRKDQTASTTKSREYPDEPRVGVGVVILRRVKSELEVLLARRAKPPGQGQWAFPGGSQEIGETVQECALRETLEETGLYLRNEDTGNVDDQYYSPDLRVPTCFAAANVIDYDEAARVRYHYTILEVAAVPADLSAEPKPMEDIDDVQWVATRHIRQFQDLAEGCSRIAEQAAATFRL